MTCRLASRNDQQVTRGQAELARHRGPPDNLLRGADPWIGSVGLWMGEPAKNDSGSRFDLRWWRGAEGEEDLRALRNRIVDAVLAVTTIGFPVAIAAAFPQYWEQGRYWAVVLDLVVWIYGAALWGLRLGSPTHRKVAVLIGSYLLGMVFMAVLGPTHARPAWILLGPVLATLLAGRAWALGVVAANALSLVAMYLLLGAHADVWQQEYEAPVGRFVMFVANVTVAGVFACLPADYLVRGLDRAVGRERRTKQRLLEEQQALQQAHEKLREEDRRRRELETRLRLAHKLEAAGRAAGGMAHDLNNMLMPIVAYTDLVRAELPPGSEQHQRLGEVALAADRARRLVADVLTFSRGVGPPNEAVELPAVAQEVLRHFKPGMPPTLELVARFDQAARPAFATNSGVYRLLTNLVSNALASMESLDRGRLSVSVYPVSGPISDDDTLADLEPGGDYVCLEVADTGVGMDEETAGHVFEPFFTTKSEGKGTGLGLATAHGIVQSFHGCLTVKTALGQGTRFRAYLPAHIDQGSADSSVRAAGGE